MKFRKLKIFPNVILTANKYNYSSKNGFIPKIFFIIAKINHFAYFEKKDLIFLQSSENAHPYEDFEWDSFNMESEDLRPEEEIQDSSKINLLK